MQFITEELLTINAKITTTFDNGTMYDLSNFLVNNLSKSVLIKNKTENILEISPGYRYTAVDKKLGELQVLYDEDAFNVSPIQDIATPDCKLYYPEPFIASPSFTHEEIWFIHILHYNYWLWFFFISLIMFYFITFINVVRWCNLRSKPKRETRGVSRSKCADLITACVPVSWAISIIISETVDATDYYDGFGTGEIVIGIRAYQWGWEYFYPKNIDLNYNVKPSYSILLGNSIKYNNANSTNIDSNVLWKYYQKKNQSAQLNSPIHTILSPTDKSNTLGNIDFSSIGNSVSKDSNAFKKIQKHSKITTNNLLREVSNDSQVFDKINNLYNNSTYMGNNSYFYGTKRQHNHVSLDSFLPSFSTLVDKKGLDKFCSYSLNHTETRSQEKPVEKLINMVNIYNNNFESKSVIGGANAMSMQSMLSSAAHNVSSNELHVDAFFFKWFSSFHNNYNFDNISDSKPTNNPYRTISKGKNTNKKFLKQFSRTKNTVDDLSTGQLDSRGFYTWNLFNESKNYRFKDLTSTNLSFLTAEKNPRLLLKRKNWRDSRDITTKTNVGATQDLNLEFGHDLYSNYKMSKIRWLDPKILKKLSLMNIAASSTNRSPVMSSSNLIKDLSMDRAPRHLENEVPYMLRAKEASDYPNLTDSYWLTYWQNIDLYHNYNLILLNSELMKLSHLPPVVEYAEYDFANWQALESLEDAIWESTCSAFTHDEYANIRRWSAEPQPYAKAQLKYNNVNRYDKETEYRLKKPIALRAFLNTNAHGHKKSNLPLFNDTGYVGWSVTTPNDWAYWKNDEFDRTIESCYDSLKGLKYLYLNDFKTVNFSKSNFSSPQSYSTVLDAFRTDYEENVWDTDSEYFLINKNFFNAYNNLQSTTNIKLRSTAKNSIVTYNAIQKVYKSRFDDLRSHVNFNDFTNSFIKYPFLMEKKAPYEGMLFKNSYSFFNVNFYNTTFKNNYSILSDIASSSNHIFLDIPFLLSMKSDASRYMWFDWQSRWSTIEVQPSSIARYSLAGLPYFSKKFEYASTLGEELNDSENYLTKISRARKNYMPNWAYSMYFYSKASNWFFYKNLNDIFLNFNTPSSKYFLHSAKSYWKSYEVVNTRTNRSTPSFSGLNRPNVVTWSPINDISAHYYNTAMVIDILSKREYLYRQFLGNKLGIHNLPKSFTVSPQNTLLREIQASYLFLDPTTYSSEVTREFLYKNSKFLHYLFLKDFLKVTNKVFLGLNINFDLLSNYFIQLFGYRYDNSSLSKNSYLYKSQYRPMKKGVVNMIRLQATNAIAMPTEIRLHLLASSKDVIHSWAIPSAGIKIDCVPGYSSHRIAIFLTHGIFWGQCMEICGRYHHWMPIVVYFMKRDLFFLWCTHFMHYSDIDQTFNMNDKQLIDYLRLVSFDKTSWIDEINKSFI
jgi:heme/copper-type cytochrome/quinol oxidase subunit 2